MVSLEERREGREGVGEKGKEDGILGGEKGREGVGRGERKRQGENKGTQQTLMLFR